MSLELSGTNPVVTAWGNFDDHSVRLSYRSTVIHIPHNDMCALIMYYLTNTDLVEDDMRLWLIKTIKQLRKTAGFNKGAKRLEVVLRKKKNK